MKEFIFTKQHTAFIKGIAILLMIWHHALIPEFYVSPEPFMRSWGMTHLSMGGKFCVGLFTFIMGYGYACSNNHSLSYSLKHIWRLLKQYWILCLLVFFPLGILFGGGKLTDWQTILYNLAGLKFQYNCASWFVLFYVYAMLAIIPLSRMADAKPYMTLLLSIVIFGIAATFIPAGKNIWCSALNRCCFYTPVLVAGYVAAKMEWIKRVPNVPSYVYLVLACFVLIARCLVYSVKGFSADTVLAPVFILAIVAYLNKAEMVGWVRKSFERLGQVSMYMWFLHAVFFSDYTKAIFQERQIWINNPFAVFIITTVVSYMLAVSAVNICKRLSSSR